MKTSRRVRIRADFVLDFHRELSGTGIVGVDALDAALVTIARALVDVNSKGDEVEILPGGRIRVNLDHRTMPED